MSEYRRQIVTGGVVAAIIAIIIVAGAVYLPLNTTTTPAVTTYSTQHNFPTTYSSSSGSELQLQINLNASQIQYGGHISVKIELFNPSSDSVSLNVNYSNDQTILNWNTKDFLCSLSYVNDLFGFALYQGYYTSKNISTASNQLVLAPDAAVSCPTAYQPNISKVTIAPGSDSANFSYSNPLNLMINATTQSCQTQGSAFECGQGSSLYGYWTSPPANENCSQVPSSNQSYPNGYPEPNCNLVPFPVGSYTLVSQDLWNHTVYAYFQVTPQESSPVQIVSVEGPIPPYNPGGPVISVTLKNVGKAPIVSLIANLNVPSAEPSIQYTFSFAVNSSVPLLPRQSITSTLTLIGASVDNSNSYQLTVSGTLDTGSTFSFIQQVMIVAPSTSVSTTVTESLNNQISSSVISCSTTFSNYTVNSASLYLNPNSGSTANLCVKYFYYNTTAPITINTLDQLTVFAPVQSLGTLKNVNSSFSISASIPQIQIGGPQLKNEGTLVTYAIKSTGSAPSGTYEIGLSSGLYPKDIICGWGIYINLQVGNITNPTVVTFCHYVPTPENNSGLLYSEIVGITNSTS